MEPTDIEEISTAIIKDDLSPEISFEDKSDKPVGDAIIDHSYSLFQEIDDSFKFDNSITNEVIDDKIREYHSPEFFNFPTNDTTTTVENKESPKITDFSKQVKTKRPRGRPKKRKESNPTEIAFSKEETKENAYSDDQESLSSYYTSKSSEAENISSKDTSESSMQLTTKNSRSPKKRKEKIPTVVIRLKWKDKDKDYCDSLAGPPMPVCEILDEPTVPYKSISPIMKEDLKSKEKADDLMKSEDINNNECSETPIEEASDSASISSEEKSKTFGKESSLENDSSNKISQVFPSLETPAHPSQDTDNEDQESLYSYYSKSSLAETTDVPSKNTSEPSVQLTTKKSRGRPSKSRNPLIDAISKKETKENDNEDQESYCTSKSSESENVPSKDTSEPYVKKKELRVVISRCDGPISRKRKLEEDDHDLGEETIEEGPKLRRKRTKKAPRRSARLDEYQSTANNSRIKHSDEDQSNSSSDELPSDFKDNEDDDGDEELSFEELAAIPGTSKDALSFRNKRKSRRANKLKVGNQVMVLWQDDFFYTAKVLKKETGNRWQIRFDDGHQVTVPEGDILNMEYLPNGTRVFVFQKPSYGQGTVRNQLGDAYTINLLAGGSRVYSREHVVLSKAVVANLKKEFC